MPDTTLQADRIEIAADWQAVQDLIEARQWGDGLPVTPPTPEAVAAMLRGTTRDPQERLGKVPPRWGVATVETVAINAVMAGCRPEYLPVVLAGVEAMLAEEFNLYGLQATTHPIAPLLLVNGPVRKQIGLHSGAGAFGPGFRPNATIGRALRLVLLNIGGARPGVLDRATQGSPAKYSYCVAENEEESPWEPYHVSLGFDPEQSVVTVLGGEPPHNVNNHECTTGQGILKSVAGTAADPGSNNMLYWAGEVMVLFGPEHAYTVARDGYSRRDVQRFVFEHARLPLDTWDAEHVDKLMARRTPGRLEASKDGKLTAVKRASDILVGVVGGPGKHSCVIPTFGFTQSVSRLVQG